jgi:hypothetical protein
MGKAGGKTQSWVSSFFWQARALFDGIDTSGHAGLHDRALIALIIYSFARIGTALGMTVRMSTRTIGVFGCGCARKGEAPPDAVSSQPRVPISRGGNLPESDLIKP